jgi:hypothetical protein
VVVEFYEEEVYGEELVGGELKEVGVEVGMGGVCDIGENKILDMKRLWEATHRKLETRSIEIFKCKVSCNYGDGEAIFVSPSG